MPGRKDFGVLRSSFYSDERAHRAAEIYAERELAREDIAFAAVAGHVVQLGLWAMRETDDGVLPGDGVAAVLDATRMPRATCREVIAALTEAGLLRASVAGLYLVGFTECYEPIVGRRLEQAKAKREKREAEKIAATSTGHPADVSPTSPVRRPDVVPTSTGHPADPEPAADENRCPADVSPTSPLARAGGRAVPALPAVAVPERSERPPLFPPSNGHGTAGGSASPLSDQRNGHGEPQRIADILPTTLPPKPLTAGERAGILAACGAIIGRKDVAPELRSEARTLDKRVRAGEANPDKVREWTNTNVYSRDYARVAYTTAMKGAR